MKAPHIGLLAALALAALTLSSGDALGAVAGDLDPSFDGDGKHVLPLTGVTYAALVQPDGKIVLAGSDENDDFAVWRLNPDGSPDRGFDGDGAVAISLGSEDAIRAAALQPDGKIVVAGKTFSELTGTDIAVARLSTNGSLDKTFDPGGPDGDGRKVFRTDENVVAMAVLVQPDDGHIVLAGQGERVGTFALRRLDSTGVDDGTVFEDPAGWVWEYAIGAALQADGSIVVTGEAHPSGSDEWVPLVARYTPAGSLDETFADTGVKPLAGVHPVRVLVRPGGEIVVAANAGDDDSRMVVTQLTRGGERDRDFGDDGTASADFEGFTGAWDVVLQPDRKVVVAGFSSADYVFAAARFRETGALDAAFGSGGRTTVAFDDPSQATAVALQPDGRLVLAGVTGSLVSRDPSPAVARLLGDPSPPASGGGPIGVPSVPRCAGRRATIVGTAGRDTLRGTPRADVIVALGGNDRVLARGGNDLVCGGAGNDRLSGGRGRDRLLGGQGRDVLGGGAGRDRCAGDAGRDRANRCERLRSL